MSTMTKQTAKLYVLKMMRQSLQFDLENGSAWIYEADGAVPSPNDGGNPRDNAEIELIEQAIFDEMEALDKRTKKR